MKYFLILILVGIIIIGCSNESTDPNDGLYSISGKISNSFGAVTNAKISIDNKVNWETTTSSSGEFSISNVSSGDHTLFVKKEGQDEEFVEMKYPISVNTNLTLNNLILPIPVRLYAPTNITKTEMTIIWNKTDAQDFREYKLYRKDTHGIDETTGELIFVSTSKVDTSFVDENLIPYETYYYRVYLMNEFGRLGGSNIANATTLGGNLIPDGSFDDPTSFNINWFISVGGGNISYSDSVKVSGNYSLYGIIPDDIEIQTRKTIQLAAGKTYEFSGWAKANGYYNLSYETVAANLFTEGSWSTYQHLMFFSESNSGDSVDYDWTFKSKIFTPSENISLILEIEGGYDRIWFDELKLEVVE